MSLALANPANTKLDQMNEFIAKMQAVGLQPPAVITPGKIHRFPGKVKGPNNQAGWCIIFEDGLGGCFGDWSSDLYQVWQAKGSNSYSKKERRQFQNKVDKAKELAEQIRFNGQSNASIRAIEIWQNSTPAPLDHPYLIKKGIKPLGARLYKDALVLKIVDFDLNPTSLQFIDLVGNKRLLSGGRKKGCIIHVSGDWVNPKSLIFCEGWATGCTLAMMEPEALVLAAIDAGNLESVAIESRNKWPDLEIVIAADDDRLTGENPGLSKAKAATMVSNTLLAIPKWPEDAPKQFTDFNDLVFFHKSKGTTPPPFRDMIQQPEDNSWPELVQLEHPDLPNLNPDLLPGWAGEFVRALADDTETPPELAVAMVLSVVSSTVARIAQVKVQDGYFEPCNLWVLVALPSGNRKSAVHSAAMKQMVEWEHQKAELILLETKRIESERKTLEARAQAKRTKAAKEKDEIQAQVLLEEVIEIESNLPEVPRPPRLWTSDSTPERLGSLLAENEERLAWSSSEGGIFELLEGRYSGGIPNLDLILKAHCGDSERVDRGSRPPVFLRHPLLTIGLSPQPDVLRGLASKPGFRGRGLLARFLYLLPPSPLGYRKLESKPIPQWVQEDYLQGVKTMLDWQPDQDESGQPQPRIFCLSDNAYLQWKSFSRALERQLRTGGELEHYTDWGSKAPGAAIRMAGVLHAIKHSNAKPWEIEINKETMEAALEIMAVFLRHSLAALELAGADPSVTSARRVWEWIRNRQMAFFTIREAFNALRGRFIRVQKLREALDILEERGYIRVEEQQPQGPGRPASPLVKVRPEFLEK